MWNDEFRGKVVWVVGGSGAIGATICTAFAEHGASVWVSGRRYAKVASTVDAIRATGADARPLVLEGDQGTCVASAAQRLLAESGRIDILINCAASPLFGEFLALSDADWVDVFEGKLMTYVRAIREVLPAMLEQGSGVIINVSGRGGRLPNPLHLAGGGMNAAVNLLTKGLSDAFSERGIRINAVAPGAIASPRMEGLTQAAQRASRPVASIAMGEASDVAQAALWLASSGATHIRGTVLPVDGGTLPNL